MSCPSLRMRVELRKRTLTYTACLTDDRCPCRTGSPSCVQERPGPSDQCNHPQIFSSSSREYFPYCAIVLENDNTVLYRTILKRHRCSFTQTMCGPPCPGSPPPSLSPTPPPLPPHVSTRQDGTRRGQEGTRRIQTSEKWIPSIGDPHAPRPESK